MENTLPTHNYESDSKLYRPMMTQEAADYLGVAALTMEGWRRDSRKRRRLLGPAWINLAVDDGKEIVRYRLIDLIAWLDSRKAAYAPARRPGRPRKVETATAVTAL